MHQNARKCPKMPRSNSNYENEPTPVVRSPDHAAGIDAHRLQSAGFVAHPDHRLEVDAGAGGSGDDVNALADLGALGTLRRVDLAVLLGQPDDLRLWIFDDVAEPGGVGVDGAAVLREGFGAGVDDEFSGDGGADHRAGHAGGAVVEGDVAAGDGAHVVVDVGAGADFGDAADVVGLIRGGRGAAGDDVCFQAAAVPEVDGFFQQLRHGLEK